MQPPITDGTAAPISSATAERALGPRFLSPARILVYITANLGFGMFYALNNATLALYLQKFTHNAVLLGLLGSSHSIEGAVVQPLVGTASDRLRAKLGRRRPFMLAAVPISTLFLLATPFVGAHLPTALRLYAVVACVVLFTISFNVAADPYQALMADITPESQRGRVMGVWMLIGVIGQASLVLLPMAPERKFAVAGLAMLVTTLLTCAATTEPKLPPDPGRLSHTDQMRRAVEGLSTLKQAKRLIVVLFFSGVGIGAVLPFLTVFVKAITGCTDHAAELMFLVLLASTGVALPPFGWMTDRAGPKPVLLCGMALVGIAAVSATWLHVYWQIGVDLAVAGLGNAAISASAYPLLTAVVPAAEVGFYTGLQSAASSIAQPLTAVVTGMLVNRGGYRLIFVVCGVSVIAGGLILLGVRVERARAEVATLDKLHGREA